MTDAVNRCASDWLAQARPAMLVQVVQHRGSVPRETGTRMLVAADAVVGTIGGGHLQLKAIALARGWLAAGEREAVEHHYPLGPALGQCCGGALTLRTAPLDAGALAAWPDETPLFTLQLYGAGHVGRAIVRLLEALPCRVQWIDEREHEFPALPSALRSVPRAAPRAAPQPDAPSAAHIERLCVEPVQAEVRTAPPGAFYVVLTHSHDLDLAITEAILKRNDFGYLGLIGSATKRARFVRRFEQRGFGAEALARITCPIGVPGITGKQPEVIALALVAQLLQAASGAARPAAQPARQPAAGARH